MKKSVGKDLPSPQVAHQSLCRFFGERQNGESTVRGYPANAKY